MEAIVFCGVQASGKTTFYAERLLHSHARISMDLMRTRHREQRFLELCVETGLRFVVDNTNPTRAERARYVDAARGHGFRVLAYAFEIDTATALERNAARTGRAAIPIAGLLGTRGRFEAPALDEGFDAIYRVDSRAGGFDGPSLVAGPPPP